MYKALFLYVFCVLYMSSVFAQDPVVLVFTKTAGWDHQTKTAGVSMVETLGAANGFAVESTDNPAGYFTSTELARFAALIFINTTLDVLDESQQAAMVGYIQAGGGFVGMHAATDCEYDWPWYGDLIGAYFNGHPVGIATATMNVLDKTHPSTEFLDDTWIRPEEWYFWAYNSDYRNNPHLDAAENANLTVLVSLDESTLPGGGSGYHPISWYQEFDGGRSFYSALGHSPEYFSDPLVQQHMLGGILWAAGMASVTGTVMRVNPAAISVSMDRETLPADPVTALTVENIGEGVLEPVTVEADAVWLTAATTDTDGNEQAFTVTINQQAEALSYGTHTASVTVDAANASSKTVPVTVTIEPSGPNLALNKPATASSTVGANSPGNAVDGSSTSRWESEPTDDEWIVIDLEDMYGVEYVSITWESAYASGYTVDVSLDNSQWTTAYTQSAGDGGVDNITLDHDARYVRIAVNQRGTGWGNSIYEIEIYGQDGVGVKPAPYGTAKSLFSQVESNGGYLTISRPGRYTVRLFRTDGRLCSTLHSGMLSRGTHHFRLPQHSLSRGIYQLVVSGMGRNEVHQILRIDK